MKDPSIQENDLIERIENAGVNVSPGSRYFIKSQHRPSFRISIGHRNENEIQEGIQRLGKALSEF